MGGIDRRLRQRARLLAMIKTALSHLWMMRTHPAEIVVGLLSIWRGLVWISPAGDMSDPVYSAFHPVGGSFVWGLFFAIVGGFQVVSSIWNGAWKPNAAVRAAALLLSIVTYTVLGMAFASSASSAAMIVAGHQFIIAAVCGWCFVNIASKMEHFAHEPRRRIF